MIGVGVAVGAAVLVLFLKGRGGGGSSSNSSTGSMDIMGGFASAGTIFVPTTSYNISDNQYKDSSVSYSTVTNNNNSQTTTTYGPVNPSPAPIPVPPTIVGGGDTTVNPPTGQTGTTPAAPAPVAPPPPPAWRSMGTLHYAVPQGGWNPGSVVDYMKDHGGDSSFWQRNLYAQQNGIANYTGTDAQNTEMLAKMKAQFGGF
jgi:hypothetical protein